MLEGLIEAWLRSQKENFKRLLLKELIYSFFYSKEFVLVELSPFSDIQKLSIEISSLFVHF